MLRAATFAAVLVMFCLPLGLAQTPAKKKIVEQPKKPLLCPTPTNMPACRPRRPPR